jgi:purine-binding chemotaxis protein CheW
MRDGESVAEEGGSTGEINWGEVYRQIDKAQEETGGGQLAPEERSRVLKERAKGLARRSGGKEVADYLEVVAFSLGDETYAFESAHVREVYPLRGLTPLPCTPPFVRGVVNVRGQILSVVDIKRFFDLPEEELTDLSRVLILRSGDMEFGVLADAILGTRRVALAEVQGSLPTLTDIRGEYLRGVTGERMVILDAEKLLSAPEIIVDEEAS